ncbi:MAG: C40 family peptidase [Gaiellales bacterium]
MRPLLRLSLLVLACVVALVLGTAVALGRTLLPRTTKAGPAIVPNPAPLVFDATAARKRHGDRGRRAVVVARRYLGVPYRWGGMSPSGFDCSGLVAFAWGKVGVQLPHNAAAQWAYGHPVSLAHLRPGDLVFFSGLGHVGIAVGHGRYIHAPQSGEVVEIDSLARRAGSIVGARRL